MDDESHISRPSKCEQEHFELEVRAANIVSVSSCLIAVIQSRKGFLNLVLMTSLQVRAGESLMKLVSDVKQFVILNDFRSVNESIMTQMTMYRRVQADCDSKLLALRDDMSADLFEMEEEYYSSVYK